MPAPGASAQAPANQVQQAAAQVPFQVGSFHYAETIATDQWQLSGSTQAQEFVHNITPGGFLRGVDLYLSTVTAGTVGTTTLADFPYSGVPSMSIENIDGSPILYPMNSYAYAMWQRFSAPWLDDPLLNVNYSATVLTPGFLLHLWPEIFGTGGVLANTDARAQYRVRYTVGPANTFANGTAYTVFPNLQFQAVLQSWAQPDRADLNGNAIQAIPPGLNLARIVRHQVIALNPGGAGNVIQLTNTGNEIRNIIIIVRDSSGVRQDWLAAPIRLRLDDRSMGVYTTAALFNLIQRFYYSVGIGVVTRPTGVYVIPRFRSELPNNDPEVFGQYWLPTTNATYLTIECNSTSGSSAGATVEIITDEVVPLGDVDSNLEGI